MTVERDRIADENRITTPCTPNCHLADAVEAASRSLKNPTYMKTEEMVKEVVKEKFADGQFDECQITGKEIKDTANTAKTVQVDDIIEAVVIENENDDGFITLSLRASSNQKSWDQLEESFKKGDRQEMADKEQKEQQNNMLISADRLKNIVADLMDAMEAEMGLSLKLVPVNVEKLVAEAINTLKPNYDKKELYLKYIAPEKLTPYFPADPTLLLQVFMNLIDDACQYTEKGGATVRVYGSGENVVFEIKDTGIGVSEEEERNLFQKFQRAKRAMLVHPDGSGLGLFIARKIVKAHNGAITLESAGVDKGTTFTVTIPAIPVIPETKALEILAKK